MCQVKAGVCNEELICLKATIFMFCYTEFSLIYRAFSTKEQRHFMQVWPNFMSATERNIICVWVCRELQPPLGLLLMRDCHSWVYSLKVDVARKSASQQINQSFSTKYQKAPGWEKTLLIDGFIMGIAVSWKVIKKLTPSSQDELQFARVRYGVWNSSQKLSQDIYSWSTSACFDSDKHISIIVCKKTRRHGAFNCLASPHDNSH